MRTYFRLNQKAIFDNHRKIFVPDTPEERVRQEFLTELVDKMGVPPEYIKVEFPLSRVDSSTRKRADIIVCYSIEEELFPLIVIELKADNIPLTDRTIKQVLEYQEVLGCEYVGISNSSALGGLELYKVTEEGEILQVSTIPSYDELLTGLGLQFDLPKKSIKRLSYRDVTSESYLSRAHEEWGVIGQDTPKELWTFLTEFHNFLEAEPKDNTLPYTHHKIAIIEDLESNLLDFGNASGAKFVTYYRGFIISDEEGNHQICRLAINSVGHTENHPRYGNRKGTTVLNIAVDNFDKAQDHVLELCLDRWAKRKGDNYELWHDGRMSGVKNYNVVENVKMIAPELIRDKQIYLGTLPAIRSFSWDDARDVVANLILYGSIRKRIRTMIRRGEI